MKECIAFGRDSHESKYWWEIIKSKNGSQKKKKKRELNLRLLH
jgi:hypothetical protein